MHGGWCSEPSCAAGQAKWTRTKHCLHRSSGPCVSFLHSAPHQERTRIAMLEVPCCFADQFVASEVERCSAPFCFAGQSVPMQGERCSEPSCPARQAKWTACCLPPILKNSGPCISFLHNAAHWSLLTPCKRPDDWAMRMMELDSQPIITTVARTVLDKPGRADWLADEHDVRWRIQAWQNRVGRIMGTEDFVDEVVTFAMDLAQEQDAALGMRLLAMFHQGWEPLMKFVGPGRLFANRQALRDSMKGSPLSHKEDPDAWYHWKKVCARTALQGARWTSFSADIISPQWASTTSIRDLQDVTRGAIAVNLAPKCLHTNGAPATSASRVSLGISRSMPKLHETSIQLSWTWSGQSPMPQL